MKVNSLTNASTKGAFMSFSYGFEKEGLHTISVQVASLGPKMLGMDIPAPAQTRAVISGDPMNGWQNDPNKFFGAKNVDFKLDVSKDGKRKPESVASTSGTVEVSGRVVARKEQHGSDSEINVEGVEIEQQQQCREMAPVTGKNREKHEQVQANAEVPRVRDHVN